MKTQHMTEGLLWHPRPATRFVEAFPLGNGRLGAMVYGGVGIERLSLNEDSLWSGRPRSYALPAMAWIREALRADRFVEAAGLCRQLMGPFTQSYLPAGNLRLYFSHPAAPASYRRELDLHQGLCRISYTSGEAAYSRELFTSFPDQLIVSAGKEMLTRS